MVLACVTQRSAEAILETVFAEDGLDGGVSVANPLVQRAVRQRRGISRPTLQTSPINRGRLPPNVGKTSSFSLCISNEIYCRFNATFLHQNFLSRGVASTLPFCRLDIHSEEVEPQREDMVVFSDGS